MTSNKGVLINSAGETVLEGICWEFDVQVNFNQTYLQDMHTWGEGVEIPGRTDVSFNASILFRQPTTIDLSNLFNAPLHFVVQNADNIKVFYNSFINSYQFGQILGDTAFFELKFSGIVAGMGDYVGYPLDGNTHATFMEWLLTEHLPLREVRSRPRRVTPVIPQVDWIHEGF